MPNVRTRVNFLLILCLGLSAVAQAAAPSARRSQGNRPAPRNPSRSQDDNENFDMADVQDFLVQVRDEFLSSYTTKTIGRSRSSTEAPEDMDWIASFFANPSQSRRSRRRNQGARDGASRDLPPVVVDDVGIDFYLAARSYALENAVSSPRDGRVHLVVNSRNAARAEDPNQWWYDFLFATQRRYIDCASNDDCASIFHRGDGLICCDVGADFFGHTHNSCVDSTDECAPMCDYDAPCAPDQYCCKRRNRVHDWNVCVDNFVDCDDYCPYQGEHACPRKKQCCFVEPVGYTICIDEGLSCPPPPPECAPGSLGSKCLSDPDRICCDEVCCPYAPAGEEQWQCCVVCGLAICNKGDCPNPFCSTPPICSIPGNELQPCDPSGVGRTPPSSEGICCGGTCCSNSTLSTSYCCEDPLNPGNLVCQSEACTGPPPENCDGRPDLAPCGADRFCCGGACCSSGESCCPEIDSSTGAITSYTCQAQCEYPLCRFQDSSCDNDQQYGVCGNCGNGAACPYACQACVDEPPNDPGSCEYTDGTNSGTTCDGVADAIASSGPYTCNCNNGGCGGAVGCRGNGNCCACQANNNRGGCACST